MKTSNSFYVVSKSLDKVFQGKYNQLRQLLEYMELYSFWKFQKKLQKDGSFYCSDVFLSKKLNLARGTIIKNRKELKKKGFINFTTNIQKGSATYIFINTSKIEEIQNSNEDIGNINDLEEQDIEDEIQVIAKNAISEKETLLKFGVISGDKLYLDGYKVKPTKEKEVGNKKKSPEKKPKKEKSNALAIVEVQAPIQAEQMDYKQRIINAWNTIASRYETTPSIAIVTDARLKNFKNVLKLLNMNEYQFFNSINKALSESKFLRGIGKKWRADFDFFLNKNKILKVIEGAYRDNPNEVMEILQDPNRMGYKEAQDLREKIKMEQWLNDDFKKEKEEQSALPF